MRLLYLIIIFLLSACMEPNKPITENDIVDFVMHVNTYGEALDVDLTDDKMVVAANYQGFIVYDLERNNQNNIVAIDSIFNDSDMASDMGDNRAQNITISKNHDVAFITDIYDRIWLYKLGDNSTQYVDNYLQDCYGGTWLSTAIDDRDDHINVFSLVKHSSSESDDDGTIGDFDEYSTSVVWKKLYDINENDLFPEQNAAPSCEFSYNFGILPEKIHFHNGLLAVSNGELGVKILNQLNQSSCFSADGSLIDDFIPSENVDNDRIACENSTFDYYNPGLGGAYEPEGGFYPYVFSSFDLPGEVDAVLVRDSIIFSGLSTSNGCYMSLLGDNGQIVDKLRIANGYSVNNLSEDNGYLALSVGHDGVLLFQYFGGTNTEFIGQLNTPYSNNVKIDGNNLIVSTEDGLYIYLIK